MSDGAVGRRRIRVGFAVVLLMGTLAIGNAAISAGSAPITDRYESGTPSVAPRENITVVTTSPRSDTDGSIVAFGPDGSVLYYDETYKRYFDVDPVPGTRATVEYIAEDDDIDCEASHCSTARIVRLNVTTGEQRIVHTLKTQGRNDWHDFDRVGPHRLLVADIATDRVFILNTTTGVIEWAYEVGFDFPRTSGGHYPDDWTHLNDVEYLDDGVVMVSLRNQDQVIFVDPRRGLLENRTLGADGNHRVLHAQHNPDYIPRERGGPAVLVADSHNNRVVEYRRANGSWQPSWVWRDAEMQWPRDADRLPNGHTLVTDSNGNRVLEVNESGAVVWSVAIDTPYEAERLGTGDESAGGRAASALDLRNVTASGSSAPGVDGGDSGSGLDAAVRWVTFGIKGLLPGLLVNALLFAAPAWVGILELEILLAMLLALGTWGWLEFRWSSYALRRPVVDTDTS